MPCYWYDSMAVEQILASNTKFLFDIIILDFAGFILLPKYKVKVLELRMEFPLENNYLFFSASCSNTSVLL